MMHPGPAALKHWDREEYAAGYRARFSDIPDSETLHHCWRCGWEDADTEALESVRHKKAVAEGREDHFENTWGNLFDSGEEARANNIPFEEDRTEVGKKAGSRSKSIWACLRSEKSSEEGNSESNALSLWAGESWHTVYALPATRLGGRMRNTLVDCAKRFWSVTVTVAESVMPLDGTNARSSFITAYLESPYAT